MQQSTFIGFPVLNKMNIYNNLYAFLATADRVRTNLELLNDYYVSDSSLFNAVSPYKHPFLNYSLNVYARKIDNDITVDKCILFHVPIESTNGPSCRADDDVYIVTIKNKESFNYPRVYSLYTDYNKRTTVIIMRSSSFDKSTKEIDSAHMLSYIYDGLYDIFFPKAIDNYCCKSQLLIPENYLESFMCNLVEAYIAELDLINSTINYWYGKPRNLYNPVLGEIIMDITGIDKVKDRLKAIFCDDSNEKIPLTPDRINTYLVRLGKALNKVYKIDFGTNNFMM